MGELLHGERSKSRIRRGIHTVKDGFLLLDVDRHFSKLKLASNGVEDQSRALGDSCSSLSLSRNRSLSPKLESPSLWLKICLKKHQWPKHGRGHGRALPQPAVPRPGLITRPAVGRNTAVFRGGYGRALPEHGRAFSLCLQLNLPNQLALGIKSTATRTRPCNALGLPVFWLQLDEMTSECPETRA
ncbi:unnamed protein product [Linum trigynum]|uniref:Uncharacterized protein n=1 Tax=Linum trigynum TaxID=586398 RepID=A0AAV2F5T5_9ROSI